MQDNRNKAGRKAAEDRRGWECQLDFPYVDSHGTLVGEDRRIMVERRIAYPEYLAGERPQTLKRQFAN